MKYQEVYRMIKQAMLKQADGPMSYVGNEGRSPILGIARALRARDRVAPSAKRPQGSSYTDRLSRTVPTSPAPYPVPNAIEWRDAYNSNGDDRPPQDRIYAGAVYAGNKDWQQAKKMTDRAMNIPPKKYWNIPSADSYRFDRPALAQGEINDRQLYRGELQSDKLERESLAAFSDRLKKMPDGDLVALGKNPSAVRRQAATIAREYAQNPVAPEGFINARNRANEKLRQQAALAARAGKEQANQALQGDWKYHYSWNPMNWVKSNKWFWQ